METPFPQGALTVAAAMGVATMGAAIMAAVTMVEARLEAIMEAATMAVGLTAELVAARHLVPSPLVEAVWSALLQDWVTQGPLHHELSLQELLRLGQSPKGWERPGWVLHGSSRQFTMLLVERYQRAYRRQVT